MRALAAVVLVGAASAHADEATELHDGLTREPAGPLLHLDVALHTDTEVFMPDTKTEAVDLALGPHTRARAEQTWRRGDLFSGQGWSTTLRLVHDFDVIQVGAVASYHRVDNTWVRGGYAIVGMSLTRTMRLSRWMTGWISLGIARRRWLGNRPPAGEKNDTVKSFSIGTTFR